ncbi:MAG: plasmid pRiA4b ORF-3 family protein [Betaproteobacteria bacterium]|nr:plasmid pRiA4b ORF-3 family protein [Betaproteobacteria bacterium]
MKSNETLIFRAALLDRLSICRDIEIEASKSLYQLAEAIMASFDFEFDHAFGFYSGLTPSKMRDAYPKYELFADIGETGSGSRSLGVKKIPVSQAFPNVGHALLFLFDYGDQWFFRVKLSSIGTKLARTRYPRVIASKGEAPTQYEYYGEDGE